MNIFDETVTNKDVDVIIIGRIKKKSYNQHSTIWVFFCRPTFPKSHLIKDLKLCVFVCFKVCFGNMNINHMEVVVKQAQALLPCALTSSFGSTPNEGGAHRSLSPNTTNSCFQLFICTLMCF